MTSQDFSKRLVIVVRKDLLGWEVANTIAHIAAYVGNQLTDSFGTGDTFVTKDEKEYPRNSQYPIIIKRANSSEQLQNVLAKARETGTLHHAFIREMIETSDDTEIEAMLAAKVDSEVELLGIGVFGLHDDMNALTKKFGLWE